MTLHRFVLIALISFAPRLEAQVEVDFAQVRADLAPGTGWSEGAPDIKTFFSKDYAPGAGVHVFLSNASGEPVEVGGLRLGGKPVEELIPEEVVWWRCFPNPVPAGGYSELYVRLRRFPAAPVQLAATSGDAELTATVSPAGNAFVDCVAFSHDMRRVYLYVRRSPGGDMQVRDVQWDGSDVGAPVCAPGFFNDVAPIVLELEKPLRYGACHYLRVNLSDDTACGAFVRAWDSFFSLGIFGSPLPGEYAAAGFNTYNSFGPLTPDALDGLEELSMKGIVQGYLGKAGGVKMGDEEIREWVDRVAGHPGLLAYYLMDEPDVVDYHQKEIPAPLRLGAGAVEMERRRRLAWELDPSRLSLLLVDNTYKPANWAVYGQLADLYDTDPYYYLDDKLYIPKVTRLARHACSPKPLLITTYIARWGAMERFPTPREARMNTYYALGEGARGINHYIHSGAGAEGGAYENPVLWTEMARINAEVKKVSPLLARATPVACVTAGHPKLYARALLCADRGMVVVLVNQDYEADGESFEQRPLHDVTLAIDLPPWLSFDPPRAISVRGEQELPWTTSGTKATIDLPLLESSLLLLLPAHPTDDPAPEVVLGEPGTMDQLAFDARFAHQGIGDEWLRETTDVALGNPFGMVKNAWEWRPEGPDESAQMAWAFEVLPGEEQRGQWSIRFGLNVMKWKAHPTPQLKLIVRTEWGLDLAERQLETPRGSACYRVPVTFSRPGRYSVVLQCRGDGPTRLTAGRGIYVVPDDWLKAHPEQDTLFARAGFRPEEWRCLMVSSGEKSFAVATDRAWNPLNQKHNCREWYFEGPGGRRQHMAWSFDVAEVNVGKRHDALVHVQPMSQTAELSVLGAEGSILAFRSLGIGKQFRAERIRFTPQKAGKYELRLSRAGMGGAFTRAASCAYFRVMPQARAQRPAP